MNRRDPVPKECRCIEDFHKVYLYRVLGTPIPAEVHDELVAIVWKEDLHWKERAQLIGELAIRSLKDEDMEANVMHWIGKQNIDYKCKLKKIKKFYPTQDTTPPPKKRPLLKLKRRKV